MLGSCCDLRSWIRREHRCFGARRSEEHTSELQSQSNLVCRLLLEKKKNQLNAFAVELPRVARVVGTAGRLSGQANVFCVAGTMKYLTDSIHSTASSHTAQVRTISE